MVLGPNICVAASQVYLPKSRGFLKRSAPKGSHNLDLRRHICCVLAWGSVGQQEDGPLCYWEFIENSNSQPPKSGLVGSTPPKMSIESGVWLRNDDAL